MAQEQVDVVYSADVAGYTRTLGEAIAVTEQYSKATGGLQGSLNSLATTMSTKVLSAAKGFSAANQTLTGQAAAYQQALAPLEAATVTLGGGFDELSDKTRKLARDFPIGINQAVQTMRQLQQLGVGPQKSLGAMAESMTKLGAATGSSIPAVTYEMTQLSRSFGNLNPQAVEKMSDSLVNVTNKFGGSAQSVLQFSNAIAPLAKQAGLGQTAVMGFATAFSRLGEDGYRSANAFNKMLLDMDRSIREGSDTMRVYANTVGKTVDQFKELYRADPAEALTQVVEGLNKQGPDAIRTLEMMGLEGTRTLSSLTNLAKSGDLRTIRDEALLGYGSGAAEEASAKAFGGLNDQLNQLNETLSQVGAQAGKPFLGFMETAAKGATGLAGTFEKVMGSGFMQALMLTAGVSGGLMKAAMVGGSTAIAGGGLMQLGGMVPQKAKDWARSGTGKATLLGGGTAALMAGTMMGSESDIPWSMLGMGALGAYGAFGRGKGAGRGAAAFGGLMNMFALSPLMAWTDPKGTLAGKGIGSGLPDDVKQQLNEAKEVRKRGIGGWGGYYRSVWDITGGMTPEQRAASTKGMALRTAGAYVGGTGLMAAGGLRVAGSALLRGIGGPMMAAGLAGYSAYSTVAASNQQAEAIQERTRADPFAVLNEFRNATGRANEAMASLAESASSASKSITEITEANKTWAEAIKLSEGEVAATGNWESFSGSDLTQGTPQAIAQRILARSAGKPTDIALMLRDVLDQTDRETVTDVEAYLERYSGEGGLTRAVAEQVGAPQQKDVGGFWKSALANVVGFGTANILDVFKYAFGMESDFTGYEQQGAEQLFAQERGAEIAAEQTQIYATLSQQAELVGGETQKLQSQRQFIEEVLAERAEQAKAGNITQVDQAALTDLLENAGFTRKEAEGAARLATGEGGWFGGGDASAQKAMEYLLDTELGQRMEDVEGLKALAGSEQERRIRASGGPGGQLVYVGEGKLGPKGSAAAESMYDVLDEIRAAGYATAAEGLEAIESGALSVTKQQEAALRALTTPESVGAGVEAAELSVARMRREGLTLRQIEQEQNRLIETGELPAGSADRLVAERARAEAQYQRQFEQAGMSRTQRWAEAEATWADWQEQGIPEDEGLIGERQQAKVAAKQAKEERRQYMLNRLKAQENFQLQVQRSSEDFARQTLWAQQDFQKQMARQEYQFYLGRERMVEDYGINVERAEFDYYLNRNRSVEDFNRSMQREMEDHQRSMERMAVDTAKSMADPYQRIFGQATYSAAGLASNLKEQERLFEEQMGTLDALRKRGLSQEAIDVLGLAEAGNAQQAITLGEASRAEIRRLNRLVGSRVELGGEYRDESLGVRRSLEDRQIALRRQRQDMRRNLRRSDADFNRSLERQDADFRKSLNRSMLDFQTTVAWANEDFLLQNERALEQFALSTERAAEDLDRSFRDINGDMKSVTREYRRFVRGETVTLEGLITDTDAEIASSVTNNRDMLMPPEPGQFKGAWKEFGRLLREEFEGEFELAPGITIFVGGGAGGAEPPAGGGRNWGGTAAGGAKVNSGYGMRKNPVSGKWSMHNGTDYDTRGDVFSPFFGMVTDSGWYSGYGPGVVVKSMHEPIALFYGHLNTGDLAEPGEVVKPGDKVGSTYPGAIGNSTGQHLHLEVLQDPYRPATDAINPRGYLKYGGVATREHPVLAGESGPEAIIPLDKRGLAFMSQSLREVARHVDGVSVAASESARMSQTTVYNQQSYSYDQSTRFTGPVTVQSNDPNQMAEKLASKARRDRALNGVGV